MRTPRYLPRVRNGAVAKRQTRSKNPAKSSKALGTFSVGAGIPDRVRIQGGFQAAL